LTAAVFSPASAQVGKEEPKKGSEPKPAETGPDYREFFKKPTNTNEFWNALQFEIDVGRFDLAAAHLHALLQFKPSDGDLVKLADQVGVAAFLRLRNVLKWYDNPKSDKQAHADVDDLINRVTAAVKAVRGDPKRIQMFIDNLLASPEEKAYALKELFKSGAAAVPQLIQAIRTAQPAERAALADALGKLLRPETVPPTLAALDSNDPRLQEIIIDLLRKRAVTDAVPSLWYLSTSQNVSDEVRLKATDTLAYLLDTSASKLPPAKVALTQEAEKYLNHQIKFPNPTAVAVWRWDGKGVVQGWPGAPTIPASRAEEYYGLKYAGQALTLDPTFAPAQIVWLSLALDKAQQAAGLAQSLEKAAPTVHAMLASVSADLVNAVLEQALNENRVPVILAAVRALGVRDEVRANKPHSRGVPPLVRALYYPDRRVQFAAAEAMLRIPDSASARASVRVVEILRRALAADPGPPVASVKPKVLIGYFDQDQAARVASAVASAGFEPVKASTGRAVLQRLSNAADIELILIDAGLPDPGLDYLIAQLRADVNAGLIPVVLTAPPEREDAVRRFVDRLPNVIVVSAAITDEPRQFRGLLQSRLAAPDQPPLSSAEKKDYAERSVAWLNRVAKGELPGYDVQPASAAILSALRAPSLLRPEGQILAAETAARLPGPEAQRVLADAALDAKRPAAVRVAAASQLVRHIQANTPLLPSSFVNELMAVSAQPSTDPPLKAQLAVVLGSLNPSARVTGERLLRYQPVTPAAPKKD
jgi:CheY-like chemotaxis protein